MYVCMYIYIYTYIYIYSDPKVDRIFFGGCGFFVGIMLDVGQRRKNNSWNITPSPGEVEDRQLEYGLEG